MAFVILTGASGSGKTSIAEAVATRHGAGVDVYHFDRIGIPPIEQMIAEHGSGEAWQRAKTFWWMSELAAKRSAGRSLLFEGQTRLAFLRQAAAAANVTDYMPILVDCDDAVRVRRLTMERGAAELANPTMLQWARFLRDEAQQANCAILDTTDMPLDVCVERVWAYLRE